MDLATNRKAFHEYEILDTYEAGLVLVGTEIKSLRSHGGNIQDAYIIVTDYDVILKNASIAPYIFGNIYNHEERRPRKLLLHKKEIIKLDIALREKGLTLIPLSIYLRGGFAKLKVAVARGKKLHDKRRALQDRMQKRSINRILRGEE
jgi:SsrA-binding protein